MSLAIWETTNLYTLSEIVMGNLYTKMKIFHYKDKIDSLPEEVDQILAPLHVRIKPTNICNHNCWYCSYKVDNVQLGKDMVKRDSIPEDKMMEIIEDIVEMGVKSVTFSGGGEPFAYPYLLRTVKELSQTPVQFASLTNGAQLKGELAEVFSHCAQWIRVSMDGWDDKSYARYRGVREGEFTRVLNNMKEFKKLGGACYLSVSLVIDKDNGTHIYDFMKRLQDIGVNSVKVSPCIISNAGTDTNEYHRPFFRKVKEAIEKIEKETGDNNFEIFDAYYEVDKKFEKNYQWCPYLQILPGIGADLNIYSCQDKAYNLDDGLIGSIKLQRFKDFWFSDKNKFFKINPSLHCNHHCVANLKNELILDYLNVDKGHLAFV